MARREIDMLHGPMVANIIRFAMPIALATIVQQLFHSIDMAVIGMCEGQNELAAVGSNTSLVNLIVSLFTGLSSGANVVIAQLLGAGKEKMAKKAAHTSLYISVISGILVMVLGVYLSPKLLIMMDTPPEIIDLSTQYLRIYFLGMPFLMIYNFTASILRSKGETTRPFYCLVAGGIVNAILNLIFVLGFDMSVAGVAIATSISNLVSCILVLIVLYKTKGPLKLSLPDLKFDKFIAFKIIKMGLPMGIQSCLFPISNIVVQSSVNSLGAAMVAGNAAGAAIETYSWALNGGFSQAMVSFVSQNYGAKNIERCKKAIRETLITGLILSSLFNLVMYIFIDPLIGIFTTDPALADIAKFRLIAMYLSFPTGLLMDNIASALRGFGHTVSPTVVSVLGICVFRILWLKTVFIKIKTYWAILIVYPISWILVTIGVIILTVKAVKKLENKELGM
ncbi:MAG: MATE family efflux transporter [Ruminococcaceae bacterium]|nr:MATE family efflux transporter [Oscillospiraceae bacterium]